MSLGWRTLLFSRASAADENDDSRTERNHRKPIEESSHKAGGRSKLGKGLKKGGDT
jgi:hypothetical protein